jgi:anion-transporting  ArsA/GET3 family ATPase
MLGTPSFLAELIDRLLAIAEKVQSNPAYRMLVAGVARGDKAQQLETAGTAAKSKMLKFQLQMYDLEDLFANPDQTEFMIVTIATELAVRESLR